MAMRMFCWALTVALTRALTVAVLVAVPAVVPAVAQQACQALQGTDAYATCLNQTLNQGAGRSTDPTLRALEDQARGVTSSQILLNQRTEAPAPAYSPEFLDGQASQRQRLQQSTQSQTRALSDRITDRFRPTLGVGSDFGH